VADPDYSADPQPTSFDSPHRVLEIEHPTATIAELWLSPLETAPARRGTRAGYVGGVRHAPERTAAPRSALRM